jgi:hypothetical protein
LLQLPKVSLKALDVLMISEASQAFALQLFTSRRSWSWSARDVRAIIANASAWALEFSLKLQVRVLPHELIDPLVLQPFPTLTLKLV